MSQPPQPPNQPPSGGFGAPQEPSKGGFGTPQQPPTPPAPPAVPPTPPAQPPTPPAAPPTPPAGHAPPQIWDTGVHPPSPPAPPGVPGVPGPPQPDPSNPYAQAHPQPGFGGPYGTPPGQPYGAPPPGGGGQDKKRKALIIGAAVAVLLAAGGGVYAAVGGGDDAKKPRATSTTAPAKQNKQDPTTQPTGDDNNAGGRDGGDNDPNDARQAGEAKLLYQTPAPEVTKSGVDVPGFWVMKGFVVKTVQDKVIAYKDDGSKKWTLSLPKAVCAAPNSQTDGKVVVAYGGNRKDSCSQLALLDLNKGTKLWDHDAPEAGPFGSDYNSMGMSQSGDLVGLSWFGGSAIVKVGDGKEVSPGELSPACSVDGFAGGKALLRAYSCNDGTAKLQKVTPNGKIKWAYTVRKGYKVSKIFSTSPAVIALSNEDRKSGGILAISESGKERSVLDLGKQSYQPQCGLDIFGTNMGGCQGVAASADTFYLPTEMKQDSGSGSMTEIHAFDLNSGKKKWAVTVDGRMLLPLRVDGKNLIAYEEPSYDHAGLVVSIGPGGGKPKTLLQLPEATRGAEDGFYSATRTYEDGTFYIASNRLTGNTSGESEKLLMVFGS